MYNVYCKRGKYGLIFNCWYDALITFNLHRLHFTLYKYILLSAYSYIRLFTPKHLCIIYTIYNIHPSKHV